MKDRQASLGTQQARETGKKAGGDVIIEMRVWVGSSGRSMVNFLDKNDVFQTDDEDEFFGFETFLTLKKYFYQTMKNMIFVILTHHTANIHK